MSIFNFNFNIYSVYLCLLAKNRYWRLVQLRIHFTCWKRNVDWFKFSIAFAFADCLWYVKVITTSFISYLLKKELSIFKFIILAEKELSIFKFIFAFTRAGGHCKECNLPRIKYIGSPPAITNVPNE